MPPTLIEMPTPQQISITAADKRYAYLQCDLVELTQAGKDVAVHGYFHDHPDQAAHELPSPRLMGRRYALAQAQLAAAETAAVIKTLLPRYARDHELQKLSTDGEFLPHGTRVLKTEVDQRVHQFRNDIQRKLREHHRLQIAIQRLRHERGAVPETLRAGNTLLARANKMLKSVSLPDFRI
jgi:hypothetical protein